MRRRDVVWKWWFDFLCSSNTSLMSTKLFLVDRKMEGKLERKIVGKFERGVVDKLVRYFAGKLEKGPAVNHPYFRFLRLRGCNFLLSRINFFLRKLIVRYIYRVFLNIVRFL